MDALGLVTLGIALWGAALSTFLAVTKRRRRVRISANWDVARLGPVRNHLFFIVSVVNVGERAVTIRQIEWEVDGDCWMTLHVFRHSKGDDLPVKVEVDEELRILFDPDAAAKLIARQGATTINIFASGRERSWRVDITDDMRANAEEYLEPPSEWKDEVEADFEEEG